MDIYELGESLSLTPDEVDVLALLIRGTPITKAHDNHSYGCVLFRVPPIVVSACADFAAMIDPRDLTDKGIETDAHITCLHGLTESDPAPIEDILAGSSPPTARFGAFSCFHSPDYDVLKVDVDSLSLTRLNAMLSSLPHEKTHPTYHAHLTIAYVAPGTGDYYARMFGQFPITSATLTECVFSDADNNEHPIELAGTIRKGFDPNEKRDESGKWSTSGGGQSAKKELHEIRQSDAINAAPAVLPADEKHLSDIADALRLAMEESVGNPKDQCIATAYALKTIYPEAEIYSGTVSGEPHTLAKLAGKFLDVTADQFGNHDAVQVLDPSNLPREYRRFEKINDYEVDSSKSQWETQDAITDALRESLLGESQRIALMHHADAVRNALKSGKDVPREVSSDYPEYSKYVKKAAMSYLNPTTGGSLVGPASTAPTVALRRPKRRQRMRRIIKDTLAALDVGGYQESASSELLRPLSRLIEKAFTPNTTPAASAHQEGQKFQSQESPGKWFVIKGGKAVPTSAPGTAEDSPSSRDSESDTPTSKANPQQPSAPKFTPEQLSTRQTVADIGTKLRDGQPVTPQEQASFKESVATLAPDEQAKIAKVVKKPETIAPIDLSQSNKTVPDSSRKYLANPTQASAVREYTGGGGDINDYLWSGKPLSGSNAAMDAELQEAFDSTPEFTNPVTVKRGLGLEGKVLPTLISQLEQSQKSGHPYTHAGYVSTTTSDAIMGGDYGGSNVVFTIKATHGLDAAPVSQFKGQDEVLLNRDSRFKVVSVKKTSPPGKAPKYAVEMEQLPPSSTPPRKG